MKTRGKKAGTDAPGNFDFLGGLAQLGVDLPLGRREGKHRSDAPFEVVRRRRTVLLLEFAKAAAGFAEFRVDSLEDRVKVVDFWLPKLVEPVAAAAETLTASGAIVGAVPDMSPEQAARRTLEPRDPSFMPIKTLPFVDPVRSEERYHAMLRKMHPA